MAMKINLPRDQEEFIERLVESGRFATVDDAISASVRALEATEQLRQKIQLGIEAADAGDVMEHSEVFDDLRRLARQAGNSTSGQ
jgi:antitoxin ParD1/3/4